MQAYEKLDAVNRLVMLGQTFAFLELDAVALIDKVVSPPTDPRVPPACQPSSRQPVSPTIDELFLARKVGKIAAIKAYRTRTGLRLKEAKDNIELALDYFGWASNVGGYESNTYPAFLFEQPEEPIPF